MAFIVPGVARFALNHTLEGRNVVNIVDMDIDISGGTETRDGAVFAQAGIILDAWVAEARSQQADDLIFQSVSWVDLDSIDGSTGSRTTTVTNTLPLAGLSGDAPVPSNSAALVTKSINGGRARRNGRMYFAGITELQTTTGNGSVLEEASRAGIEAAVENFWADINQDSTGTGLWDSEWVVVHVTSRDSGGNPLTGDSRPVVGISVDSLLASQRRRMRG